MVGQPFPGLRSFEPHEAFLFRGRQQHTEALLSRLAGNRFVAVVGTSGSGKSSLVRAGLLPALQRGYLTGATSRWRIAIMRPGSAPMDELAKALSQADVLGEKGDAARRTLLSESSMGLVRTVEAAGLSQGESLLVVVDQFEELFRFQRDNRAKDDGAEASLFVQSLLAAADHYGAPIYVVLTMRSDYLGDCSQFQGLPEALNQSQYLIPRLTREQRRQVIEEPAAMSGTAVTTRLVQRLLNDAGDDVDQLPILQHALMRTHLCWKNDGAKGEMDLRHYEEAGGIAGALDAHASAVLNELDPVSCAMAQKVLRCLTDTEGGREIRRPASMARLCDVVGAAGAADRAAVDNVIRAFSRRENSLLLLSGGAELHAGSVVDISHECLIRKWSELNQWVKAEARSAEWYRDLAVDVARHDAGEKGFWRDPDLGHARQRYQEDRWNAAWAAQYWPLEQTPSFDKVIAFLDESQRTLDAERAKDEAARRKELQDARALAAATKRASRWLVGAVALLVLLLGAFGAFYVIHEQDVRKAAEERNLRLQAEKRQTDLATQADDAKSRMDALNAKLNASAGQSDAEKARLRAELEQTQKDYQKKQEDADAAAKQLAAIKKGDSSKPAPNDDALKQIDDLRGQLLAMRAERDRLQAKLNATTPAACPTVAAPPCIPSEGGTTSPGVPIVTLPPITPPPDPTGKAKPNSIDREQYVWIGPGSFLMGCVPSDKCDKNDLPQHPVTVAKGFWIGQNEVRVIAYKRFVQSGKDRKMPPGPLWDTRWRLDDNPVVNMNWQDAVDYCVWAGGRLPTEVEWEYAARAGKGNEIYPSGLESARDNANVFGKKGNDTFDLAAPVRHFNPNAFGLYDMSGNVWEFVNDAYGKQHVARGGSWNSDPQKGLRLSAREATGGGNDVGFRCALDKAL